MTYQPPTPDSWKDPDAPWAGRPFGARRPCVLKVARDMGFTPVMWNVTCYDWKPTTAERVERHALRQVSGGDIILMHDGGHIALGADRAHTIAATDRIIEKFRPEGYSFTSLPA